MPSINVGSVSVTVVPDASNFVPRLRQDTTGVSAVGDDIGRTMGDKIASRIGTSIVDGVSSGSSKATASAAGGGDSAGGAFADAFKKRVEAALAALPDAKIGADATDADRKLAELRAQLEELSGKTVGVDLSDEDAKAKLDSLKASLDELGHKSESVSIKVDTAAASAELAKFRAELDTATAGDGGSAGGGIFAAIQSGANGASGAVTPMVAAISMLAPALVPIGAAAAAGLGGIATMALAGAAGVGVLYLGLSDVMKAVQAVSAQHQAAAADAVSSANAQLAAANQVKSAEASLANARASAADSAERSAQTVKAAEQGVADAVRKAAQDQITAQENLANAAAAVAQARVSSAQQVATAEQALDTAEQSLTNAVYTETQAQQALVTARQAAQRQLESYQQQIADGALTQRQDLLNVQTTKQALDATLANPAATVLQREQAQLTYDQAVQALADQQRNYEILKQDAAAAAKAGVDGAANVVAAQHQVLTAQQGVATAQQGVANATAALATAQTNAARAVATALQHQGDVERQVAQQQIADQESIQKAHTAVTNAVEAQATAQRQAAFSVAQAQQSVAVALEAQHRAATSLSSSQQAVATAMAQLTPAGQGLVGFIAGTLMPAFNGLKGAAENGLLPGIQALLNDLMPALPSLTTFVGALAQTMGGMFSALGKELTDPFWKGFFSWLAQTAGPTLQTMATVVGGFVEGLAGMIQAMSPLTDMIGQAFAGMATGFANFATNTRPGSPLEQFISYAKASLPVVGSTLEALASAFGHIIVAAAPIGLIVLKILGDLAQAIVAIPTPILVGLIGALTVAVPAILGLSLALKIVDSDVVAWLAKQIAALGTWVAATAASTAETVGIWALYAAEWLASSVASMATFIAEHAVMAATFVAENVAMIASATAAFVAENIASLGIIAGIGLLVAAIVWMGTHWSEVWSAVVTVATESWHAITGAFSVAWDWISKTFSALWGDAKTGVGMIITGPLEAVASTVTAIWGEIKSAFVSGVNDVIKVINGFIDAIDHVVSLVPGLPSKLIPDIPLLSAGPAPTGAPTAIGGGGMKRFADGGVMPGYAPGADSILSLLSPGEGVLRPEATRWLGADTIHGLNRAAKHGMLPAYADGGVAGYVAAEANSGWSWNPLHDAAKLSASALEGLLTPIKAAADAAVGALPAGFLKSMAGGIINELFGSHTATGGGSSGTPYAGPLSGGAAQWGPDVAQVAGMLGIPVSVVPGVLNLISHESGGNPNAINLWDSNAAAGHPSQGLMQTIASTFEAYRSASLPDNILDPLANIYAGMNYAMHNYGVGMLMAGGRTDSAGNYIGYDQGGWLQPGFTPVWNGTGAPEPVLNPSQWEGMKGGSGKDGELLAAIRRVETLLEQNPHQVAAGVAGEFQRAAIAHADRSLMNARTR